MLANLGLVRTDLFQQLSAGLRSLTQDSGHQVEWSDSLAVPFIGDRGSCAHSCLGSGIRGQLVAQKWVGIGKEARLEE